MTNFIYTALKRQQFIFTVSFILIKTKLNNFTLSGYTDISFFLSEKVLVS